MYKRNYLENLIKVKDDELIKVLLGVRRSGKSVILKQLSEILDSCLYIDLEDFKNINLRNPLHFNEFVLNSDYHYILIDEVQLIENFEDVINSLRKYKSLYITGSNSNLLSSNLSTLLSGRYMTIPIYPFSFNEVQDFKGYDFKSYLLHGGMPTISFENDEEIKKLKLDSLIDTIIINDILNYNKNINPTLLKTVFYYILENIGSEISIRNITNTFISKGMSTTYYKIDEVINALENAGILYSINKYKVKGKQKLVQNKKFYIIDVAFSDFLEFKNLGANLENIIFIELLKNNFEIYYGDNNGKEIDFIAIKQNKIYYIQVSLSILEKETYLREISSFNKIPDNKFLITLDDEHNFIQDPINYYTASSFIDFLKS